LPRSVDRRNTAPHGHAAISSPGAQVPGCRRRREHLEATHAEHGRRRPVAHGRTTFRQCAHFAHVQTASVVSFSVGCAGRAARDVAASGERMPMCRLAQRLVPSPSSSASDVDAQCVTPSADALVPRHECRRRRVAGEARGHVDIGAHQNGTISRISRSVGSKVVKRWLLDFFTSLDELAPCVALDDGRK